MAKLDCHDLPFGKSRNDTVFFIFRLPENILNYACSMIFISSPIVGWVSNPPKPTVCIKRKI
ncbi:MAG: hypothetical protein IJV35_04880 [Neisseriaceae bacterium]|nr:hypothetical protein [Neisseriaceae bacterium]